LLTAGWKKHFFYFQNFLYQPFILRWKISQKESCLQASALHFEHFSLKPLPFPINRLQIDLPGESPDDASIPTVSKVFINIPQTECQEKKLARSGTKIEGEKTKHTENTDSGDTGNN
jgi:hypothetical protein